MTDAIALITQASATVTSLLGISTVIVVHLAYNGLSDGYFKNIVRIFRRFLLISTLGVSSMTIYHFAEESYPVMSAVAEDIWYLLMFTALLVTLYGSSKLIDLGKKFTGR